MDETSQSLQALWLHAVDYRDASRRCCCEGGEMKAMYSVYDRNGDCFDFCDDEETEHSLNYEAEHDRLRVWQWSAERQSCKENNQIIAEFYQPRRFIKDFTL
jgi:fructosamine-3-kinase